MDRDILVQYCEIMEEIKYIRRKIMECEKFLKKPGIVSDFVKGTRKDGTYGSIKITGYPSVEFEKKERALERYKELLETKEVELLELTIQAEKYIESVKSSELRVMFRLYYIEGLPWWKVANTMNRMFPRRRVSFTEDSCRVRNKRFFEKN